MSLYSVLRKLLPSRKKNRFVLKFMPQVKQQWRVLYQQYEQETGYKAFVIEPSVVGGGARRMRALPRNMALQNVTQWIPVAQQEIHAREVFMVAAITTPTSSADRFGSGENSVANDTLSNVSDVPDDVDIW
jgi:hypothetical protein